MWFDPACEPERCVEWQANLSFENGLETIPVFNHYVMDYSNALWRQRAFEVVGQGMVEVRVFESYIVLGRTRWTDDWH